MIIATEMGHHIYLHLHHHPEEHSTCQTCQTCSFHPPRYSHSRICWESSAKFDGPSRRLPFLHNCTLQSDTWVWQMEYPKKRIIIAANLIFGCQEGRAGQLITSNHQTIDLVALATIIYSLSGERAVKPILSTTWCVRIRLTTTFNLAIPHQNLNKLKIRLFS